MEIKENNTAKIVDKEATVLNFGCKAEKKQMKVHQATVTLVDPKYRTNTNPIPLQLDMDFDQHLKTAIAQIKIDT